MAKSLILGPDGSPIELDTLGEEISAASVTGIRQVWHASVAPGLGPARLAGILEQANAGNAYEYLTLAGEMEERDAHYGSVLGTRKLALAGLSVTVEACSDDAADVRCADIVREVVASPSFEDTGIDLADALGKGYSVVEMIWDRSAKEWMPQFKHRDPRFFQYDRETGEQLRLLDDSEPVNGLPLKPFKFLVHTPRLRTGLPVRAGLARLAAVSYMCKAWTWRDWMAFADIYGLPMRVGRYGPGASKDDIAKLMSAVSNLGSDAGAVMPDSVRIEFQAAANVAGAADFFERLANWWDKQVSKAVLGQTMTADDGASLSQAQVHNDVRLDLLTADAKALTATYNRDFVRPFVDLNFGTGRYPRVVVRVPRANNTAALVDALTKLVPLGLKVEQSVIRDRIGLPDPDDGADILQAVPAVSPGTLQQKAGGAGSARNRAMNSSGANGDPGSGDPVDAGATELLRQSGPLLDMWIEEIRDLVADAGSLASAKARLADRYNALPVTALAKPIAQAMAVLHVAGRADAQRWIDLGKDGAFAINAEQPRARVIDRGWKPAAEYFLQKINLPTDRWDDLWQGQHARAFVVAGAMKDALLRDLRGAVEDAIVHGGSYDNFRRSFDEIVQRHGWTGWTGESSTAGRAWRARLIYQTNLSTAHAAGRYQQMTEPATLAHMPYWQYRHNTVNNPREVHVGWDGLVLRWNDPWWMTHYPPNGWGCRCDVRPLSARQIARMTPPPALKAPPPGDGDPPPEWAYNVGEVAWGKPVAASLAERGLSTYAVPLDARGPAEFGRAAVVPGDAPAARPAATAVDADSLRRTFRAMAGGDSAIKADVAGARINVTDAPIDYWLDNPARLVGQQDYLPLLPELIEQPFEIWASFTQDEATGRVDLRRRYVKAVLVDGRRVGLVAEAIDGQWVGLGVYTDASLTSLRRGVLLYGRGG